MGLRTRTVGNLKVGSRMTTPTRPSHVKGVREGNERGRIHRQSGIHQDPNDARFATSTAERSTGINARHRNPIDPRSPNLSPP